MDKIKKLLMSLVNRLFSVVLIGLPMRAFSGTKVIGRENLPDKGGFIVASNHQSNWDPFFLAVYMWQFEFRFLAKHTLWHIPVIGPIIGGVLSAAGQIELNRTNPVEAEKSLARGTTALHDGKVVGIYPEGTKSHDGKLHKGKTGVARAAHAAGAWILVVARVDGEIRIGRLIPVDYVEDPTGEQLRALTDEVMAELQELSGLEYVDEYIPLRHK